MVSDDDDENPIEFPSVYDDLKWVKVIPYAREALIYTLLKLRDR